MTLPTMNMPASFAARIDVLICSTVVRLFIKSRTGWLTHLVPIRKHLQCR